MPGQETITDITARLFFRSDVERIGIALINSMFLFGESNRYVFDDYRSQVHDSDGLQITSSEGTQIWRTLSNRLALANSFFAQDRSVPFGLIQRQRDFSMYEDAEARYERRPSLSVQPSSDWGKGNIQLVEIPSDLEQNDNIVAFWTPDRPIKGGDSLDVAYRLLRGDLAGDQSLLARTVSTRRTALPAVSKIRAPDRIHTTNDDSRQHQFPYPTPQPQHPDRRARRNLVRSIAHDR